jgi:uncharacterized membrane protein
VGPSGWTGYAPLPGHGPWPGWAHGEHHHGSHPLAWVLFALLLVLLLLVIANLVATLQRKRRGPWPGGPGPGPWQHRGMGPAFGGGAPEEVLRLRYARGEISREEFLQASADLAGPGPPAS